MLTRLIVDLYGWIIEVTLWFILLIAVEIDLKAIHTKIVGIDGENRTATARHNVFLKELGLPPLPLGDSE